MHKIDRYERRGCAPIPYHLLSGLGMYAFLLSAAKLTYCTTNIFLLFLSPPARMAQYLAVPKRKFEFLINSVRLAIFRSLSIPTVSELPPKLTWSRPTPTTFSSARTILHYKLEEWLSHEVDFSTANQASCEHI